MFGRRVSHADRGRRTHCRVGALVLGLTLWSPAMPGYGQVFLSSAPHPQFAIGPVFIAGTVRPDLGPVVDS